MRYVEMRLERSYRSNLTAPFAVSFPAKYPPVNPWSFTTEICSPSYLATPPSNELLAEAGGWPRFGWASAEQQTAGMPVPVSERLRAGGLRWGRGAESSPAVRTNHALRRLARSRQIKDYRADILTHRRMSVFGHNCGFGVYIRIHSLTLAATSEARS